MAIFKNSKKIQRKFRNQNQSTKKITSILLNVWTCWVGSNNLETNLVAYESKQLDETLKKLFTEIREKRWFRVRAWQFESYAGVIGPALERKGYYLLNSEGYWVFNCRKVPEGKARLCGQGFGKRPNVAKRHSPLKTESCYGPKECLEAILHSHW